MKEEIEINKETKELLIQRLRELEEGRVMSFNQLVRRLRKVRNLE